MVNKLVLKSFRLKNFKAIKDSGVVKFTPLTVLIGIMDLAKAALLKACKRFNGS